MFSTTNQPRRTNFLVVRLYIFRYFHSFITTKHSSRLFVVTIFCGKTYRQSLSTKLRNVVYNSFVAMVLDATIHEDTKNRSPVIRGGVVKFWREPAAVFLAFRFVCTCIYSLANEISRTETKPLEMSGAEDAERVTIRNFPAAYTLWMRREEGPRVPKDGNFAEGLEALREFSVFFTHHVRNWLRNGMLVDIFCYIAKSFVPELAESLTRQTVTSVIMFNYLSLVDRFSQVFSSSWN